MNPPVFFSGWLSFMSCVLIFPLIQKPLVWTTETVSMPGCRSPVPIATLASAYTGNVRSNTTCPPAGLWLLLVFLTSCYSCIVVLETESMFKVNQRCHDATITPITPITPITDDNSCLRGSSAAVFIGFIYLTVSSSVHIQSVDL